MGFRYGVRGFGFGVWGSGFRVWDMGFGVSNFGSNRDVFFRGCKKAGVLTGQAKVCHGGRQVALPLRRFHNLLS